MTEWRQNNTYEADYLRGMQQIQLEALASQQNYFSQKPPRETRFVSSRLLIENGFTRIPAHGHHTLSGDDTWEKDGKPQPVMPAGHGLDTFKIFDGDLELDELPLAEKSMEAMIRILGFDEPIQDWRPIIINLCRRIQAIKAKKPHRPRRTERVPVIPELTDEISGLLRIKLAKTGFHFNVNTISEVYSAIRDFTAKEKP